jgi:hypothetical protein
VYNIKITIRNGEEKFNIETMPYVETMSNFILRPNKQSLKMWFKGILTHKHLPSLFTKLFGTRTLETNPIKIRCGDACLWGGGCGRILVGEQAGHKNSAN